MRVVSCCAYVREDSPLDERAFARKFNGEPWGWLEVGAGELTVYGSPAAMRRLAAAVIGAAAAAEQLPAEEPEPVGGAAGAVVGS
jgi:hypothetical protein